MGFHKTKKLLLRKGNHQQNEKATHEMGKIFAKLHTQQGVYIQNMSGTFLVLKLKVLISQKSFSPGQIRIIGHPTHCTPQNR